MKYYEKGDDSVLPRSIATREAFLNAMTLDIAMGGSTNTVLHLLAIAREAEVDFKMDDIDLLSDRKSTRLNSSHANISYAVFCLKKKNITSDLARNNSTHAMLPKMIIH